jgi:hypothetical protein
LGNARPPIELLAGFLAAPEVRDCQNHCGTVYHTVHECSELYGNNTISTLNPQACQDRAQYIEVLLCPYFLPAKVLPIVAFRHM